MVNNYYLKYFIDAVSLKSVTKAAKLNHVSVSAISQAIHQLENSYDIKLTTKKRNNFKVTPEGFFFYEQAISLVKQVEDFQSKVQFSQKKVQGRITFSAQQSFGSLILPNCLLELKSSFPLMDVNFKVGKGFDVKHWVSEEEIDFGFAIGDPKYPNTKSEPVYTGSFVCIRKKGIKKKIKNLDFLLSGQYKEVDQFKKMYKAHHGKEVQVGMNIESWGILSRMAIAGLGICFIPDYHLLGLHSSLYSVCRMGFELPKYTIHAFKSKNVIMSPQSNLYFDELVKLIKKLE